MCYVKEVTLTHRSGPASKKDEVILCANSINGQTCENTHYGTETRRASPSDDSQLAAFPSSSGNGALVIHQEIMPIREKPRKERRYSSDIGIRFRGLFKSPEYYIKRLDGGSSRPRRDDYDPRRPGEMMPEAAMPPPAISYRPSSNRRSPPPSILPMHGGGPNRPTPPPSTLPALVGPSRLTPPQGPGAAAAFTTREIAPSSSRTPSRTSSSRSRDVNRAVQGLPHLTVPVTSSPALSHTSRRATPGLSRISFAPNTRFRDSAYGSSNISPIDVPKAESVSSETHSTTTSGHSANDRYNYTNNHVAVRRGKEVYRDEDEVSNSSEGPSMEKDR
ncbi:hypothetical protein D6C80_05980 [Aureobasidium pullulans]|nr:hypothetical protein D6C80_05980 [Aureobasidium pullulans]